MAELIRVSHGLWRPAAEVADLAGRAAALLTTAGPDSAVGDVAAARLHGLWLPDDLADDVQILLHLDAERPRDHAGTRRAEFRGRRRGTLPDEVCVLGGLRVTTPARTWVDLAERLSLADLVAAGDSVLRGGTAMDEIAEMVTRARRRRGVVRARQALPLLNARSRSRPESHMRVAIVRAGLPYPGVNQAVFDAVGQWLFEPDLSYEDVKLALEYNGRFHAGLRRMRRDITRSVDAGYRGGWRTETFGPSEVFGRPDELALYVRQLRHERAGLLRPTG